MLGSQALGTMHYGTANRGRMRLHTQGPAVTGHLNVLGKNVPHEVVSVSPLV